MPWLTSGTGLEIGVALALSLGAVMGSFACAVAWRLPRGGNWVSSRSCCPACGVRLHLLDLVPILSWLALRGQCRHCGERISPRYPGVEGITALAFVVPVVTNGGMWVDLLPIWLLVLALMILTLVDISHRFIPDGCTFLVAAAGLLACLLGVSVSFQEALIGAALLGGGTLLVRWGASAAAGREALGLGDVKLFAAAGLWIGPMAIGWLLALSALAGLAFQCIRHKGGTKRGSDTVWPLHRMVTLWARHLAALTNSPPLRGRLYFTLGPFPGSRSAPVRPHAPAGGGADAPPPCSNNPGNRSHTDPGNASGKSSG